MRCSTVVSCILLLVALTGGPGYAQTYPTKPIRIVVPFSAGSVSDILARGIAKGLTERLGQSVVVENRAGAGGNIGTEAVAKAAPDGYTVVWGTNGPFAANVSLYAKLPFDPLKDFSPIALLARGPIILVANRSVAATSVPELIQSAKARPGALNFGATQTTARVATELLKSMAGINVVTVLYKDVGTMFNDLMGGQIQYAFENVGPSMPLVQANKIKAVALTSLKRTGFAPHIPTLAEFGYTRFELVGWLALFAPKGTPAEIIVRLNAEVNKIMLESSELIQLLASIGMDPPGGSPEQLADFHKAEIAKWAELVKTTGIRLD